MKRIDPFTKEEFAPHRRNQIFKCAKNRIAFNNEKAALIREEKSTIDKVLLKNYKILNELMKQGESLTLSEKELSDMGFDIKVFTHIDTFNGYNCICLYKYIIARIKNSSSFIITIRNINGKSN